MTELEPKPTDWVLPPTISRVHEFSNDLLTLVVYNLSANKGFSLKTGRPFVVAVRLMDRMITGIQAHQLNEAIGNLYRAGTCVAERRATSDDVKFMFYLTYENEPDVFYDKPYEVDPKLAMYWEKEFSSLEAIRLHKPSNYTPPSDRDRDTPPVAEETNHQFKNHFDF